MLSCITSVNSEVIFTQYPFIHPSALILHSGSDGAEVYPSYLRGEGGVHTGEITIDNNGDKLHTTVQQLSLLSLELLNYSSGPVVLINTPRFLHKFPFIHCIYSAHSDFFRCFFKMCACASRLL